MNFLKQTLLVLHAGDVGARLDSGSQAGLLEPEEYAVGAGRIVKPEQLSILWPEGMPTSLHSASEALGAQASDEQRLGLQLLL